ncbi:MAG: hypothetical protein CVT80_03460 [Alphaproteobacteria bacterium HGW-Alphaproteobacteria-2]|nr:MAG: hypothetical protein CVT80_03460 [Alphaproteobacteria bacterium HGW-Alphaproteobacteria-2]
MTLIPMPFDGTGPSQTCLNLSKGMRSSGAHVAMYSIRSRLGNPRELGVNAVFTGIASWLPYIQFQKKFERLVEKSYFENLLEGDVCYLWLAASLRAHRRARQLGNFVILEGINTRMKFAKSILDNAYEEIGEPPAHGINYERIEEEEEKLSLSDSIFAPNSMVENALIDHDIYRNIISSSYGVNLPEEFPEIRPERRGEKFIFMFCGYACVRKGIHHLLSIWNEMPRDAVLRIVGGVEPVIEKKFSEILKSDRVELTGFVRGVDRFYQSSDAFIFPTLEEGGPQVTYEAAVHGLPIVTTPMGAGRMGNSVCILGAGDRSAWLSALLDVYKDRDLRFEMGRRVQETVRNYDWDIVGARRYRDLGDMIGKRKI